MADPTIHSVPIPPERIRELQEQAWQQVLEDAKGHSERVWEQMVKDEGALKSLFLAGFHMGLEAFQMLTYELVMQETGAHFDETPN